MTPQQYAPLIGVAVALTIVLLRNRAPRTLRLDMMWIMPAIFIPLIGFGLWGMRQSPIADVSPYAPADWAILVAAAVLGIAAGWWRGRMVTIHKDSWLEGHAEAFGLNITAIEQAFLVFVVGLIVVQRLEMYLRARSVMAGGSDGHLVRDA